MASIGFISLENAENLDLDLDLHHGLNVTLAQLFQPLLWTWILISIYRVRTGYGILEKLWNFEKQIPYMEKLWNWSKTAVPMEKLWNFRFCGKKMTSKVSVASVITSLGLALRTSRAIALASVE